MTERSPVAPTPDPAPEEETDYGKAILGQLTTLNERLSGWDGLLSRETNTETSFETPTPEPNILPTRASTPESPAAPENVTSPTSGDPSSGAPEGDSKSDNPTVDPAPVPPKADNQQSRKSGLGFLKGGKRK